MKIVYIAGPYNGADYLEIDDHINDARFAAALLANHGVGYFCPHLNSAHFEAITPKVPETFWKALDLKLLEACDGIYLLTRWQTSRGARAELDRAEELGLRVFREANWLLERDELIAWSKA